MIEKKKNRILLCVYLVLLCGICFSRHSVRVSAEEKSDFSIHVVDQETGNNTSFKMPDHMTGDVNFSPQIGSANSWNTVIGRNIIGSDDRVLITDVNSYPYTTMARITVTYQDGTTQCGSGAMIGPRLVATAGHVLINGSLSHPRSIKMEFGMYGTYTYYTTTNYSSYIYYGDYQGYDPSADYGFIVLPDETGSITTGHMGIRTACDPNQAIYAAGYPGGNPYLYTCGGNVTTFTDDVLTFNADFTAGESGGPIYVMYEGLPYLMGTISGNYGELNYGRRLNTALYLWLHDNGYI